VSAAAGGEKGNVRLRRGEKREGQEGGWGRGKAKLCRECSKLPRRKMEEKGGLSGQRRVQGGKKKAEVRGVSRRSRIDSRWGFFTWVSAMGARVDAGWEEISKEGGDKLS